MASTDHEPFAPEEWVTHMDHEDEFDIYAAYHELLHAYQDLDEGYNELCAMLDGYSARSEALGVEVAQMKEREGWLLGELHKARKGGLADGPVAMPKAAEARGGVA